MMATINLLYKKQYSINDSIRVMIPTVGQVLENEYEYYNIISALTAMPIDFMCQLDDMGIDFTQINDYELFLLLFGGIRSQNTSLVFGDLDLSKFNTAINKNNNTVVLIDKENNIVIDRAVYGQVAAVLRKIHHLEKNRRKPANEEVRKYLLERERIKMKKRNNHNTRSQLESLIVAMVNTEQYKYNFEEIHKIKLRRARGGCLGARSR